MGKGEKARRDRGREKKKAGSGDRTLVCCVTVGGVILSAMTTVEKNRLVVVNGLEGWKKE